MIVEKTPYPAWANPYQATWTGSEWVVRFSTQDCAETGLMVVSEGQHGRFAACNDPNSNEWFVYEVKA